MKGQPAAGLRPQAAFEPAGFCGFVSEQLRSGSVTTRSFLISAALGLPRCVEARLSSGCGWHLHRRLSFFQDADVALNSKPPPTPAACLHDRIEPSRRRRIWVLPFRLLGSGMFKTSGASFGRPLRLEGPGFSGGGPRSRCVEQLVRESGDSDRTRNPNL